MPLIILTADVEDGATWASEYRVSAMYKIPAAKAGVTLNINRGTWYA